MRNFFYLSDMDTSVTVSIDKRHQKKDGTYPLVLRLGHKQSTTTILLRVNVLEKDWDAKKRIIKSSYKGTDSVARLNNEIQKKRNEATDIIMQLHDAGDLYQMSIGELRSKIDADPNQSQSFYTYTDRLIAELKEAHRHGTAFWYQTTVNALKLFQPGKDLSFKDINYRFLTKFEISHASKGNNANGLSVYFRAVRAIYNKAIKAGIAEKELYPFTDYKIKSTPTEKRALDWPLLKKIIEKEIPTDHESFNGRNYFLASYMMYGMNFTDMAFLKKTDIRDGRIQYRRKKTSKIYDIKLTSNLESILSYYINLNPDSEYIFPIIKRKESALQHKDIMWARKCYNKRLKTLAAFCGIEQNLTSYVSRHSFATQAMLQQVPLNAISAMLGHSSLKTTEIYLKSLPTSILDDYNEKIMQGV